MKTPIRTILTILSPILIVFLVSCTKSSEPVPEPDFTIQSTTSFEVTSAYENGWIEKGVQYDDNLGLEIAEFEYYENGYLKNCKKYTFANDVYSVATHYLFMELSRDESNLPTKSIYYNPDNSIRAEILYERGLMSEKKIYENNQEIVCTYSNGRIETVVSNLSEGVTQITYDYTNEQKVISITRDSEAFFDIDLPLISKVGEGFSKIDHHPRANRFSEETPTDNTLNTTFNADYSWSKTFEPFKIMPVPISYSQSDLSDLLDGYFSRDFDLFRMVTEEFPYFEDEFLSGDFKIFNEEFTITPSIALSQEVKAERVSDPIAFKLKYGEEYIRKRIVGKYGFSIGVLRNLPTDPTLRQQLKDLAYKRADHILGGSENLSLEEEILLNEVFFELKYHSPVLGISGTVLASRDDYLSAVEQIENNDNYNVQKILKAYEEL